MRAAALSKMGAQFKAAVRLVDVGPMDWLLLNAKNKKILRNQSTSIGDIYLDTITSQLDNQTKTNDKGIIDLQLESHMLCGNAGADVLRTYTEYLTTPYLAKHGFVPSLQYTLHRSLQTCQHYIRQRFGSSDELAISLMGMLGKGGRAVQVAGCVGNLYNSESMDIAQMKDNYEEIFKHIASQVDIVWIQNVHTYAQLRTAYKAALKYKDADSIWLGLPTPSEVTMPANLTDLFDFLLPFQDWDGLLYDQRATLRDPQKRLPQGIDHSRVHYKPTHKHVGEDEPGFVDPPGALIVSGRQWKELNQTLVAVKSFTELAGMTQFGVIIDSKEHDEFITKPHEMGHVQSAYETEPFRYPDKEEWDGSAAEVAPDLSNNGNGSHPHEWDDVLLKNAASFWIDQGVSIIGCGWLQGQKLLRNVIDEKQQM